MRKFSWKTFLFLLIAFLIYTCTKYLSPLWVRALFDHQQFDLLNKVAGSGEVQSLGFYLGQAEARIFGPLSQVLAGVLLFGLGFTFLKNLNLWKFIGTVLLFLVLTKAEVLFYPVYGGDAISGPFAEARWLAQNHFDYLGLSRQPGYTSGGPKVYIFSIYPTFLAGQMVLFRSPQLFLFFNHLWVFIMAAGVIALFREILRKIYEDEAALLGSLALFCFPLFQAQTEMINMEMPCLLATVFSAYYLASKRFVAAGLAAVMAACIKVPGAIAAVAVFAVTLTFFLGRREYRREWPLIIAGLVPLLIAGIIVLLSSRTIISGEAVGSIRLFFGVIRWHRIFDYFLAGTGFIFLRFLYAVFAKKQPSEPSSCREKYRIVAILWLYAGLWFLLFMNYTDVTPRYKLLVYPFLFFTVLVAFLEWVPWRVLQKTAVVGISLGLLFASYGFWGDRSEAYHYIESERSLEYQSVMKRDILLTREIEQRFPKAPIAASSVIAQMMAWPELGYVRHPREVVIYGMSSFGLGLKNFSGLKDIDILRTVWIADQDDFAQALAQHFPYPVDPQDHPLGEIVYGPHKAVFFMGGLAIEKARRLIEWAPKKRNKVGTPAAQ